ncbi:MAG: stage II sporulation protein M [Acidobacteriota bacterium]|nr:MAG: stage II sporulation protein M [Acidobacteriota bacterium]
MDYGRFQRQSAETWASFRGLLVHASRHTHRLTYDELEQLAALHRRVLSDFAYARTHFPGTDVERSLRGLAFEGHRLLTRHEPPLLPRIRHFFAFGFPRQFRRSLPAVLISLGIFSGGMMLGFVLTLVEPDVAQLLIGVENVERVRRGEVWTDAATRIAPAQMSSAIFTNNVSVALVAWGGGLLAGLLTIYVLVLNGLLLGSVLSLTWQHGVLDRIVEFISAHGPLELFLIIVAGAAGLELAHGLVGESPLPRKKQLRRAGRRSVILALGTLAPLVVLGLVEGFVSPDPAIGVTAKSLLGIALLGLFLVWALRRTDRPLGSRSLPRGESDL